jgi:hypothetical protein
MQADWITFIANLRHQIEREGQMTMTIGEIVAGTHSRDSAIRDRGFWRANQRGGRDYEGFANAGIALEFTPDGRGQPVESVTFRLTTAH